MKPSSCENRGTEDPVDSMSDLTEAAALLRELLDAIKAGELTAAEPRAVALVRRLEGALIGLEQASKSRG